ncbi:hypothetical protein SPRG_05778 [Saprolegnia parasitica CBS 223.65]|uniref:EGF-like domain-containing protein n=1 Tax=Saprolegnia parasitica (strain CBS 223.65) TaxID=695850 RepID=A0A067CQ13_SAPPC|nr:hypothetical protein SPRG_05778 [Saprolegnia parasitica CBS 223.65]KDO28907.1 hypothetical protein SPRG_05778 [Saprolegnia parasitica CBS 223.65]|eukprot:XP_012200451.1 hypothetical protein SPRG_05778 [Saprolegnia parasitica CBS 223.65]
MKWLLICALAALLPAIEAYCPNGCNAQGTCGANDKCTCYLRNDELNDQTQPMFTGADCSRRTCSRGKAFVDIPTANEAAHQLVECSNRGLCDYASGVCQCFPGFEGKACERMSCPNDCNHHGVCLSIKSIVAAGGGTYTTAWDAEKSYGCLCDQGYRGPDCSLKECPSAADVLLGYGATEGRDCGGRGTCDYVTGDCQCFPGYYGTTCGFQSTVH